MARILERESPRDGALVIARHEKIDRRNEEQGEHGADGHASDQDKADAVAGLGPGPETRVRGK